jgi:hypothetical protein
MDEPFEPLVITQLCTLSSMEALYTLMRVYAFCSVNHLVIPIRSTVVPLLSTDSGSNGLDYEVCMSVCIQFKNVPS